VKSVNDFKRDDRPDEPDHIDEGASINSDIHGDLFGLQVKSGVRYEPGHPLHVLDIGFAVGLHHLALLLNHD
jgi:hypothetical protein